MPTQFPTSKPVPAVSPSPRWGRLGLAPRRRAAPSWTPAEEQRQPQDGAVNFDATSRDASLANARRSLREPLDLREPEDARLTGGTRSLMRRVLGLNVTKPASASMLALPRRARKPAMQLPAL